MVFKIQKTEFQWGEENMIEPSSLNEKTSIIIIIIFEYALVLQTPGLAKMWMNVQQVLKIQETNGNLSSILSNKLLFMSLPNF